MAAALAGAYALLRTTKRTRTLEQELERGKTSFDEVVSREIEQRAADLERTLALARSESLSALIEEERRITEPALTSYSLKT